MIVQIVLCIFAMGCLFLLVLDRRQKRIARKRIKARSEHGRIMESKAGSILESLGHEIVERHPEITYTWQRNDTAVVSRLKADYLTEFRGKSCIIEVKTGDAANVNRRETRRQLLEYSLFGSADEVWILNGDTQQIERIKFPILDHRTPSKWLLVMFSASLLTNILAVWLLIRH